MFQKPRGEKPRGYFFEAARAATAPRIRLAETKVAFTNFLWYYYKYKEGYYEIYGIL
jgi:hypothetical protein